jgi:aminoglycoside/choline kinase family phosphotransferase
MWYNKNLETLKDYEIDSTDSNFDKLLDTGLGDITKQVYRDFNIDNLLD